MADNNISQDDIDSLLQELQGSPDGDNKADKLGDHAISQDDIEGLLTEEGADPVDRGDNTVDDASMIAQEQELLNPEQVKEEKPAQEEKSDQETETDSFDFSNIGDPVDSVTKPEKQSSQPIVPPLKTEDDEAIYSKPISDPMIGPTHGLPISPMYGPVPGKISKLTIVQLILILLLLATSIVQTFVLYRISPQSFTLKGGAAISEDGMSESIAETSPEQKESVKTEPDKTLVENSPKTEKTGTRKTEEVSVEEVETEEETEEAQEENNETELVLNKNFIYKGFSLIKKQKMDEISFKLDDAIGEEYIKILEIPHRLVIDLRQTKPENRKWVHKVKHRRIKQIRIGIQPGNSLRIVVEFNIKKIPKYKLRMQANGFSISLD